jgi:hypothetical protein
VRHPDQKARAWLAGWLVFWPWVWGAKGMKEEIKKETNRPKAIDSLSCFVFENITTIGSLAL